ncbi:DUF3501 family protein [Dongia soli]|uniref:DUF3501 family protein n=1 Tax=Dongia soli TaxID=600628 RepID=A0ABU5E6L9_9PROT|nr:DUF3501 family protein [Dongia soli]MDY0881828.1 DUF3501 family protein [Dongia soli]
MSKREITRADILPLAEYAKKRVDLRREIVAKKKRRRMEVGPAATFYFECYETMLQQVQEMLYIEKGGEAQIADELDAYNPLIPDGTELIATVMFEIDDPVRRARFLARLGDVEHHAFIRLGADIVRGKPEQDQERTNEAGKASSVHFIHFAFDAAQIRAFRSETQIIVGFDHPEYSHMAVMSEAVRQELAGDFA